MQQLAQSLQQLSQNANVKVVDYAVLRDLLPDVPGWDKKDVHAQSTTMGVSVSTADARYTKGDQSVKLTITDTALSQLVLAPMTMMLSMGYKEESDDGYKRAQQVGGYPGWEEWQKSNQHAETHALVAQRFIVEAESDHTPNSDVARQFLQAVNLGKLAGLAPAK